MNRKEFAAALSKNTGKSNAESARTIAAVIDVISGALKKGDTVSLVGFGSFILNLLNIFHNMNMSLASSVDL